MNVMQVLPATFPPFPDFKPGEVWLVGAGPGDPRLATLMAAHALRSADIIVHDALIDLDFSSWRTRRQRSSRRASAAASRRRIRPT